MKISIIVPAFNEEKLLGASLGQMKAATAAFTKRGWDHELIVCDNNSTDQTAEIARAGGATVIFEPFNQIGRARNTGASAATGDWFIFVDADSHPDEGLFNDVAGAIVSGKYLAGGSTVQLDEKLLTASIVTGIWNWLSRLKRLLAGSFIFVEATAFRKLGGFSGKFFAAEELELSMRLNEQARAAGKKIVILHRHPMKTSARKLKLYTLRELGVFLFRTLFQHRKTLTSREAAYLWYDGRR